MVHSVAREETARLDTFDGGRESMRRLLSMGAFAYGFWMLWTGTEMLDNAAGLGVIGVAVLLELMSRS